MKIVAKILLLSAISVTLATAAQAELIGHWTFDEGSGTTALDSSGNGHDGAILGGATYTAGQIGSGALQFNGTDSYVDVPYQPDLSLAGSDYTVSVWSKWEGPNSWPYQMLVAMETGFTWDGWYFTYNESNAFKVGHASGSQAASSPWSVPAETYNPQDHLGEWMCLTVSYDSAAGQSDFYVNGQLLASNATSNPVTYLDAASMVFGMYAVGNSPSYYRGYYSGALDDIQIYDQALTASEVAIVAGGGVVVPEPSAFAMLIAGLLGLIACNWRKRN